MVHELLEIQLKAVKCTPKHYVKKCDFGRTPSNLLTDSPLQGENVTF